jgi:hypothetical protein
MKFWDRVKMHARYAAYVFTHKWYVFKAGRVLGVPLWRLVRHDWSKFTPAEWGPYARHFYGDAGRRHQAETKDKPYRNIGDDAAFQAAWQHHIEKNDHHYQHWYGPYRASVVLKSPGRPCGPGPNDHQNATWAVVYRVGNFDTEFSTWADSREHAEQLAEEMSRPMEMSVNAVIEMVADWCGASFAKKGYIDVSEWYEKNKADIRLAPMTRKLVERLVMEVPATL